MDRNFDELSEEPSFFMDVAGANRRFAASKDSPYSMQEGTFKVPDGISRDLFDKLVKKAGDKWITSMDKKGWTLRTRVKLFGPFSSADLLTGVPLLGEKEFRLRAVFATVPKPIRIEVPSGLVQRDPDQKLSLQDAQKALQ